MVSATIIGPLPELYFGPPYLVNNQHHLVSFSLFCLLPIFASTPRGDEKLGFFARMPEKWPRNQAAIE
jgi:hypothetical protein